MHAPAMLSHLLLLVPVILGAAVPSLPERALAVAPEFDTVNAREVEGPQISKRVEPLSAWITECNKVFDASVPLIKPGKKYVRQCGVRHIGSQLIATFQSDLYTCQFDCLLNSKCIAMSIGYSTAQEQAGITHTTPGYCSHHTAITTTAATTVNWMSYNMVST
jgi:hypothetical protein